MRSDAGLVEQLRRERADERFDLACELAFLGHQLQHAAGDRAQGEQAARSSTSCLPAGRVAASRCNSRARFSGRNSPRSGRLAFSDQAKTFAQTFARVSQPEVIERDLG